MGNAGKGRLHKRGDVVIVAFPFTDFSGEKRRPALVVGDSEEHVVVAFITTRTTGPQEWHVPVSATEESGIVSPSIVRCDKIVSVDVRIVPGGIGRVPQSVMRKVDGKLRQLLGL